MTTARLLAHLSDGSELTPTEAAAVVGRSRKHMQAVLVRMYRDGLLVRRRADGGVQQSEWSYFRPPGLMRVA